MKDGERIPAIAYASEGESRCGLSRDECRQCSDLPEARRGEWRAGRLALKRATSMAIDVPVSELTTGSRGEGGVPLTRIHPGGEREPLNVRTSLTHRDGHALGAADPSRRVGIDLERRETIAADHERYFLTEREREAGAHDATTLWCLKEAAWKALGCDGSTSFHALELGFDADGSLRTILLNGESHPAGAAVTAPLPGYTMAVVWLEDGDS